MKFVQQSYDENDLVAKNALIKVLTKHGWTIISAEENYDHDVIAEKNGEVKYFEVEMKSQYKFTSDGTFPFPTVSFLGRKKRLHDKHPFLYVIISKQTGWAVCCESSVIFQDQYIEKVKINTRDRQGIDTMYRVPKGLCRHFNTI